MIQYRRWLELIIFSAFAFSFFCLAQRNLCASAIALRMSAASLTPRTVNKYVEYIKQVVKSLKAPNGEPIHKRTWDAETMDLAIVESSEQKRPSLKAKTISKLITESTGQEQTLYVLLAATGIRISEALALEVPHIINDGRTIKVEQQVEKDRPRIVKYLKTDASKREIDLHPDVRRVPATVHSRRIWTAVSHGKADTTSLPQP